VSVAQAIPKVFGGTGWDVAYDMIPRDDGGLILVGTTNSNDGDFDSLLNGSNDLFMIRLNALGDVVWRKTYKWTGSSSVPFTASDSPVGFNNLSTLQRVESDKRPQNMVVSRNGSYFRPILAASSSDQGVLIACTVTNEQTIDFDRYPSARDLDKYPFTLDLDIMMIQFDSAGSVRGVVKIGGSRQDIPTAIAMYGNDVLLTGYTYSYDGNFSSKGRSGGRDADAFVAKFDSKGKIDWLKVLEGSQDDVPMSVCVSTDGSWILGGWTRSSTGDYEGLEVGSEDAFLMHFDPLGRITWKKTIGGIGSDVISSIVALENGGWAVAGETTGKGALYNFFASWFGADDRGDFAGRYKGGQDVFVARLDPAGNKIWTTVLGGNDDEVVTGLLPEVNGDVIVYGWTRSDNDDFDDLNHGYFDVFTVRLDVNGVKTETKLFGGGIEDWPAKICGNAAQRYSLLGTTLSNTGDFDGLKRGWCDVFLIDLDTLR
jgi:hypothetical protein